MTDSIQAERDELQRELTEFTYRVSHDFSAPLRTVTEFSRLLQEDYSDKLDPTGQQYVGLIIQAGDKMRAMLEGILVFSRLNTEPAQPELLSLEKLMQDLALPHAAKAEIQIGNLPDITADPQHMRLLFAAVLDNAVKFVANGTRAHVSISAERKAELWEVSIRDNGIGIASEFHQDIFMIFRRLHKDTVYPGLGFGLALAKKITALYGGDISVDSNEGKGSTFKVSLLAA